MGDFNNMSASKQIKIFIAGDSTAATKDPSKYPETGWGQVINLYFNDEVCIRNFAKNGRSSKSFIDEGLLDQIAAEIQEGDYLFIQFGHNDEKDKPAVHTDPQTTFKEYLTRYIDCARNVKATPVLLTPVHRRNFDENGKINNTHGEYPQAMRELSKEKGVTLLDITEASRVFFEQLGVEKTKEILLWLKPGENPNYPNGVQDNTHFSEYGAKKIAGLVIEQIKNTESLKDLAAKIKE